MRTLFFIGLLVIGSELNSLSAQEKISFTATHLWQMERVGSLVLSPDGKFSLYTLTKYNIDKNESSTFIYFLNNENGEQRQLTYVGKESSPFWAPNGKQIGFISRRDDKPGQLYILDRDMGEARRFPDNNC